MRQHADAATRARALAMQQAQGIGREDLGHDAAIVISELVTNAMLHGGGCTGVEVMTVDGGIRVEVSDGSRRPPVVGHASEHSLTGRGLRIVGSLSESWGAEVRSAGKVVWAIITGEGQDFGLELDDDALLAMWDDDWAGETEGDPRIRVEIGDVPTDLLLAAKSHVDNVVREFALASAGAQAGLTAEVPEHLLSLLRTVVERFAEPRLAIKHQALDALRKGTPRTRLVLDLPVSAADAAEEYMQALDEVDAYSRAMRLLTLETPPQHRVFRHWYIGELIAQLRAAAAGVPAPAPESFDRRLLRELDRLVVLQSTSDRAARLYSVAAALATAATPQAVAEAVLNEGVAALSASGGGVLLASHDDTLELPGTVGYDDEVVARLRRESRDAELPAAVALRTGEAVWIESRAERDERFPELVGLEANTVSMCAVPLQVGGRRLGALRFSFTDARLFDEGERQFVLALAAQTAQALDRAQLQLARMDVSRRLQRSLLPPSLPEIPGMEVAALYHPFGDGMDVGGDFYDVWQIGPRQWAIAIGDATGTGPEAAALSALLRHTARALTLTEHDPAKIVANLNTALLEAAGHDDAGERFTTATFGVVEAGPPWQVRLAGGGHPPALLRRDGGDIEVRYVGGALLGVFPDVEIGTTTFTMAGGDTLVLFTDGVIEARNGGVQFELAGVQGVLREPVTSAAGAVTALERAVLRHVGGTLTDDVAAVVLRVR